MITSALRRSAVLQKLDNEKYDLLVIGGGITGAGIALDAASRKLKTLLVEKEDFASGTSSRSTKLIHGGLRYLKQFEIALVREVGRERAILHKLAPHLVTSEKMLLPLIKGGSFGKFLTSFGLMIYDVLAGVESADQRKMLSKQEALEMEPLLDERNLEGAGIYAEYRTDDARLTIEVLKAASRYEAMCVNYLEAVDFIYEDSKVVGVNLKDRWSGEMYQARGRVIVSAAGPWVDELRRKDHSLEGKRLHLTKGVHIVVPHQQFPVQQAVYFDVPDGRMVFAIPRGKVTYIGTTDTDYFGSKDHVVTNLEDVNYLLKGVNHAFPHVNLSIKDVESSWAGLRPLIHEEGKSASELSRKDEIFTSESGLISIAGGKLTGYRKMAERVVDLVVRKVKKLNNTVFPDCKTDTIPLGSNQMTSAVDTKKYQLALVERGLDKQLAEYLVGNYGKESETVLNLAGNYTEKDILLAECQYCMENEMSMTLCDFFIRRTGRLYFDIASVKKYYRLVADHMKLAFGWNAGRYEQEMGDIEQAIKEAANFEPYKEIK